MASRRLCISEALWFFFDNLNELNSEKFKIYVSEFYNSEDLTVAKKSLLNDIESIKKEKIKLTTRTNTKYDRVLDIIELITYTQQNELIQQLPLYVILNKSKLPLNWNNDHLVNLETRLHLLETNLKEIIEFKNTINPLTIQLNSAMELFKSSFTLSTSNTTKPINICTNLTRHDNKTTNVQNDDKINNVQSNSSNLAWADCTCTPNPLNNNINNTSTNTNTFFSSNDNSMPHIADNIGSKDNLHQEGPWQTVANRKKGVTNKRKNSDSDGLNTNPNPYRLFLGSADNNEIIAAKSLIKKTVLYIGNVDLTTTTEKIKNYLTTRKINILALYKLNKKSQPQKIDYQSFKLIVERTYTPIMFDPSFWPKGIQIKRWENRSPKVPLEPPSKKQPTNCSPSSLTLPKEITVNDPVSEMDQSNSNSQILIV